jgi:thiamine biosynthesis protein ThiS
MTGQDMQVQLNGEVREIPDGWTVSDLLADLRIESRYCAVELNRRVTPREQHATCSLKSGDEIEVVTLVGGG